MKKRKVRLREQERSHREQHYHLRQIRMSESGGGENLSAEQQRVSVSMRTIESKWNDESVPDNEFPQIARDWLVRSVVASHQFACCRVGRPMAADVFLQCDHVCLLM
jgi:hypothetical protein